MRLMLIEDNKDLLDFLKEALNQDFAEIITMTGGKAALAEMTHGKPPDIIVSDVNMPDGDGFWLCNQLKSNEKLSHIPFVLLTARGEAQSQSESYRLGADGFLAKPFEIETLMELIRGLLKRKAEIRKKYLDNEELAQADYGSDEERFIIQLNQIIAENISNPALDQQLICRELGVSRALLYNRMKAITGAGAKEYITKIRIEKAKVLIETTSNTIAEISDMTGFASQSYFSTAFKNYTGMTPSQYKHDNTKHK
jgi:YesN/AraC family two-component response regulator